MVLKPQIGYIALKCIRYAYIAMIVFFAGQYIGRFENIFNLASGLTILYGIYSFLQLNSISYKIENKQLAISSGLISRRISFIELFRIEDFAIKQSLINRICGYSDLLIYSRDFTNRKQILIGLINAQEVAKNMRNEMLKARKENSIIGIG